MTVNMIQKLSIEHLKSINVLDMTCTSLNLLTGTNSSGKSTFIQAILLIFQNMKHPGLNGDLVIMGDFMLDAKNSNSYDNNIKIKLLDQDTTGPTILIFPKDSYDIETKTVTPNLSLPHDLNVEKACSKLHYLSCNRIGAKDIYLKNYNLSNDIGANGNDALYYLQIHKRDSLNENLCKDTSSSTLETQVNYWLKYIINTEIFTEDIIGTDIIKAEFSVKSTNSHHPRNVGSGVSYMISIIIMCLSSQEKDIIIIENPEIHLHPKAQSRICEFLYFIAASNRQLFIETHSDHVFNGIRAGIASSDMNKDLINVQFFELDNNNNTKATKIEFGPSGRILNNIDDLFDQFDIDLNKMLGL